MITLKFLHQKYENIKNMKNIARLILVVFLFGFSTQLAFAQLTIFLKLSFHPLQDATGRAATPDIIRSYP